MFFPVPDRVLLQDVLDRQDRHGENIGHCLATRVRNIIYYENAKDLQCTGRETSFGRITLCIEIANVTLDRLMLQIIPRTIFACCVGIQALNVQRQARGSASLYVYVGYWG